jgi:hypothetical protein
MAQQSECEASRYAIPHDKEKSCEFYLDILLENANHIIANICDPSANSKHLQYMLIQVNKKENKNFRDKYNNKYGEDFFKMLEHEYSSNRVTMNLPLIINDTPTEEVVACEMPVSFQIDREKYTHEDDTSKSQFQFKTIKGLNGARDFKQRVHYNRHKFEYDYIYRQKDSLGNDIGIDKYCLTILEKAELAARFRCLRWARWHRIFKSMKKFVNQLGNMLELIYKETCLESLYEKVSWAFDKSPYKTSKIQPTTEFSIADGFINEGKSHDLTRSSPTTWIPSNGFDSEYSEFYRAELKSDDATTQPRYLPDKYYPIFILAGIISAIEDFYCKPKFTKLVLDRAWGSIELFCQGEYVIGQTEQRVRANNPFDYEFYISLFGLMANLPVKDWAGSSKFYVNIYQYSRFGFDHQLDEQKRALEIKLYGSDTHNSLVYNQLAYKFMFCLDNIYKDLQTYEIKHEYKQEQQQQDAQERAERLDRKKKEFAKKYLI